MQAGSTKLGRDLAAQNAEVVFTAQTALAKAQAFYVELKGRLNRYVRSADSLKIMPGVFVVVGRTESEAREKYETFQQLVEPEVGVALLGRMLGNFDLSKYLLDGPLPALPLTELAGQENLSLAELRGCATAATRVVQNRVRRPDLAPEPWIGPAFQSICIDEGKGLLWRGSLLPLGREATPKSAGAFCQVYRVGWLGGRCATEREQAPSPQD